MSHTKKSHKKSRNGCKTCRERRVKCDEIRPICTNCSNRQIECKWRPINSTSLADSSEPSVLPVSFPSTPSPSISAPVFSPLISHPSPPYAVASLDMASLHLLHHYATSPLIFPHPQSSEQSCMHQTAPQIGFTHHYLMHAILAVSALHLKLSSDEFTLASKDDYLALANHHFQETTSGLLYSELMSPQSPDRDAAIFLACAFMTLFVIARPRSKSDSWTPKVLDILAQARRGRLLFNFDSLRSGPIANMFNIGIDEIINRQRSFRFPTALLDIHLPTSPAPDIEEIEDHVVAEVYRETVTKLKIAFAIDAALGSQHHAGSVFAWPMSIKEEFHELLAEQRPRALVILAHYCVLLQRDTGNWWEKNLDDDIRKISGIMDTKWLEFLNESFTCYREEYLSVL